MKIENFTSVTARSNVCNLARVFVSESPRPHFCYRALRSQYQEKSVETGVSRSTVKMSNDSLSEEFVAFR